MSSHQPIASFEQLEPAQSLARRLTSAGFEAITSDETSEQLLQFISPNPHAQFHTLVLAEKVDAVLRWLKEHDVSEHILESAIRCPDCGSSQVEYPQFSRKTLMGSVIPAMAAAVGIIERQFFCTACNFTWSPAPESVKAAESKQAGV